MFGWVFFIIPGIIFSIWFMFPRYAVVVDNERGMTAVLKSKGYAKGYFWDIFLLAALGIIAIYIPQGIISSLKIPLVDLAMGLLIAPLWVIYPYLIFKHLKETKKDLIFAPTAREKNFFAVLGVITLLIIIVFVGLLVYFAPQIENAIEQYQKQLPGATIPFERNGAV